jgi:alcohol dehydrogenase YqhD (iron-dependent ADH family)
VSAGPYLKDFFMIVTATTAGGLMNACISAIQSLRGQEQQPVMSPVVNPTVSIGIPGGMTSLPAIASTTGPGVIAGSAALARAQQAYSTS